jgi:hypothetical protein
MYKIDRLLPPNTKVEDAHTLTYIYKFFNVDLTPPAPSRSRFVTAANTDSVSLEVRFDPSSHPKVLKSALWIPMQNETPKPTGEIIPLSRSGEYYVGRKIYIKVDGEMESNVSQGYYWKWPPLNIVSK